MDIRRSRSGIYRISLHALTAFCCQFGWVHRRRHCHVTHILLRTAFWNNSERFVCVNECVCIPLFVLCAAFYLSSSRLTKYDVWRISACFLIACFRECVFVCRVRRRRNWKTGLKKVCTDNVCIKCAVVVCDMVCMGHFLLLYAHTTCTHSIRVLAYTHRCCTRMLHTQILMHTCTQMLIHSYASRIC